MESIGKANLLVKTVGTSKLLAQAGFLLAVGFLLVNLLVIFPRQWARTDYERDVAVYYLAAKAAYSGQPVYMEQPNFGPDQRPTGAFLYSPPVAAILWLYGNLSFPAFARLAIIANLIAFLVFVLCLLKLANRISVRNYIMSCAGVMMFPGVISGIYSGQADPLLWMLFALGLVMIQEPWFWLVACIVKPFYVWPLLVNKYGIKRILPAAAHVAALCVIGGIVCGWDSYLYWITDVLPTMSQGNFTQYNVSISFGVLRILQYIGIWHYPGGPLAPLPHLWLTAASIVAPALTWWMVRHQEPQLKSAAIMTAAALFAPVTWVTYLPVTLPLLVLLLLRYYGATTTLISNATTTTLSEPENAPKIGLKSS